MNSVPGTLTAVDSIHTNGARITTPPAARAA